MNKEKVMSILQNLKLAPQKSKGQNFLIDTDVSRVIVDLLNAQGETVLEIGPGLGSLTQYLLMKTPHFIALDIDRGFIRYLKETYPNLDVIEKDFLKYNVPRETTTVISNIPYYITTKIIEKVITDTPNLKTFVFMTQKDVKVRLFAKPHSKDYGPLAIVLAVTGSLEEKMTVTADKFYPAPNVDSAVFRFKRKPVNFDIKAFYDFVKFSFLNRRKVLRNNLKPRYQDDVILKAFETLGISLDTRVEALGPDVIVSLFISLAANQEANT